MINVNNVNVVFNYYGRVKRPNDSEKLSFYHSLTASRFF